MRSSFRRQMLYPSELRAQPFSPCLPADEGQAHPRESQSRGALRCQSAAGRTLAAAFRPGTIPKCPRQLPKFLRTICKLPGKLPDHPEQLHKCPGKFPNDPGMLSNCPGKFPKHPRKSPKLPRKFLKLPAPDAAHLGIFLVHPQALATIPTGWRFRQNRTSKKYLARGGVRVIDDQPTHRNAYGRLHTQHG